MAMKTVTVLKRAKKLIETKGWTQGWFAKDGANQQCNYDDNGACSFCIAGAVYRAANGSHTLVCCDAMDALTAVAPSQHKNSLASYNDAPRRTKTQVLALFDRAIAKAAA